MVTMCSCMDGIERSCVLTSGETASKAGILACLAYHRQELVECLKAGQVGKMWAAGHEACIKWLSLALCEQANGLWVTRELHVGYYLDEAVCQHSLLGVWEQSSYAYHEAVLLNSGGEAVLMEEGR